MWMRGYHCAINQQGELPLSTYVDPSKSHVIQPNFDAVYTWDYSWNRPDLEKLYEKAKVSQWNAATDIDWSLEVDPEKVAYLGQMFSEDLGGTPFESMNEAEKLQLSMETQRWTISQFLHGEQGALIACSKITQNVPTFAAKEYAATQTMDEARHVEVFSRYLDEKIGGVYPINKELQALLDEVIADPRWDVTCLGMQIMVEGLALAAFSLMRATTPEPLLADITDHVIRDEARHVAFGVMLLRNAFDDMSTAERRERQEFIATAAELMRDRLLMTQVWERLGLDVEACRKFALDSPAQQMFRSILFGKIVPIVNRLGLLDDGTLADDFQKLGILQFKDMPLEMDAESVPAA